jgi:hypothetical protein
MKTKDSSEVWTAPELTVMVRGRPEETILGACKKQNELPGSNGAQNGCYYDSLTSPLPVI